MAWRYEEVDGTGKTSTFAWSGPLDGSMQDMKDAAGQVIAKASMKRDGEAMLRRVDVPNVGIFEERGTFSVDHNTYTEVGKMTTKDGKALTSTAVYHRAAGERPATK